MKRGRVLRAEFHTDIIAFENSHLDQITKHGLVQNLCMLIGGIKMFSDGFFIIHDLTLDLIDWHP